MKICVSIPVKNARSAANVEKAWRLADLVELRIDWCRGPELEPLLCRLLRSKKGPVVVACRRRGDGGFFPGDEAERIELLKLAVSLGADIVDIELTAGRGPIASLAQRIAETGGRTKLLVSYHDFSGTPSERVLWGKMKACIRAGGDIVKIVSTAGQIEDNLRVLNLIGPARSMHRPIIAFCMGEAGRMSRIVSPMLGGAFTFASHDERSETAPGQLTIKEMRRIYEILAPNGGFCPAPNGR